MPMTLLIPLFALMGTVGLSIRDSGRIAWAEDSQLAPRSDFGPIGRAPRLGEHEWPDQYAPLKYEPRALTPTHDPRQAETRSPIEGRRKRLRGDFWTPKDRKRAFPDRY
jgi:hypothetical protein